MDTALKATAAGLAGLFSGVCLHATASSHPASMELDTANGRRHWVTSSNLSSRYQSVCCVLGSLAGAGVFRFGRQRIEHSSLWLAGSAVLLMAYPWTMIFILPGIEQPLQDNVIENYGEEETGKLMGLIKQRHRIRTAIGVTAFAIFLYAGIAKK